MKILLAGILGAIAMFIWIAIAHMAAHRQFCRPGRLRFSRRDLGRDCHQRFLLELVRISHRLYRQLHADRDRWFFRFGNRCSVSATEDLASNGTLSLFCQLRSDFSAKAILFYARLGTSDQ